MKTPQTDSDTSKPKGPSASPLTALALVGQLGLVFVVPLVAGIWIGRYFGTPGLLVGMLLGLAAGILGASHLLWKELPKNH